MLWGQQSGEGGSVGVGGEPIYKTLVTWTHHFKTEMAIISIARHVTISFSFLPSPPRTHQGTLDLPECLEHSASYQATHSRLTLRDPMIITPTRLLCPQDSPDKNTGVGCMPSSRGSSHPRDQIHVSYVSCIGR